MTVSRRVILAMGGATMVSTVTGKILAQTPADDLPRRLFADVQAYARWPHHRTGSEEERGTVAWFETALRSRGATTSRWSYAYPRYDWTAALHAGGHTIEALPLWYEGTGEVATSDPFIRPVTLPNNFDKRDIAEAMRAARADEARLAVLATFGRFGNEEARPALIACNADPDLRTSGIPTLLIDGVHLDVVASGPVSAVMSARRTPARADNIIGQFGQGSRPLLVTTPLTGWFSCAGERGTGIAVALELAAELSRREPVVVIGTTGHELENYGIRQQLAAGIGLVPRAVLHVGASLAAGQRGADGRLQLSAQRFAVTSRPPTPAYREALAQGGFATFDRFLGEGANWSKAFPELPLLSFAGSFRHFHTPADLPEASTTPALLAQVYAAVRDAVAAILPP